MIHPITKSPFHLALLGAFATLSFAAFAADAQLPPRPAPMVKGAVALKAEPFDLGDVKLLAGQFKQAMETDIAYLLNLDPNRLLSFPQKQAGLFTGTDVLLGWKDAKIGPEGADWSLGHYLSACSQMYRVTRDPRMLERSNRIVDELAKCQKVEGNEGLLESPKQKKAFEEVRKGDIRANGGTLNGAFVPFYGKHIILAGLLDAYNLCGNAKARDILVTMTDWYGGVLANLSAEQMQKVLLTEHGGMAEALANVYAVTGEPRHLELAKKFRHDEFFVPINAGEDMLSTHHANTQIPKFSGYQRIHQLTGEAEWGKAASNFWTFVAKNRSFANGGNCVREHFNPLDQFDLAMKETGGPETCNSYNMLNLTRLLFAEKAEAGAMDYYERVIYNQILPSQDPKTGGFVYNTPLVPGAFRVYMDVNNHIGWCCVGTGMENQALYGASIYAHRGDRLFVNLFIPSELTWSEQGATVTQETTFPDEPRTRLLMKLAAPRKFTVSLRYPSWVDARALKLAVNGKAVETSAQPGTFAEVTREWKDGDTLTVELPMKLHTEMLPNNTSYASVFYGPILLGAKLGREGLEDSDFHSGTTMPAKDKIAAAKIPVFVRPVSEVVSHIAPVAGKTLQFTTKDLCKPVEVILMPINQIYDERYSVYFPLVTTAQWEENKKRLALEEQREHELLMRTVDDVRCGEQQPEMDHRIKSDKSKNVWNNAAGRSCREAINGWFSYELMVDSQSPMTLSCMYWGSDKGNRDFDILVDDTVVATQQIEELKLGDLVEVAYPIPENFTRGKSMVVVKFRAKKNRIAGGVYSCRMLNMTSKAEDAARATKAAIDARSARAAAAQRSAALTRSAKVSASVTTSPAGNFKFEAVNDGIDPQSSNDIRAKGWHTWPNPGKPFWLQYDFPAPALVKAVQVYWFDETATKAQCRVPASWKLLAKVGGKWKEVESASGYGVEVNKYNRTEFKPVQAEGLRIEAKAQERWSSGVLEWKVESGFVDGASVHRAQAQEPGSEAKPYDLVVYGGNPAGITAAIAAKREGASVLIVEPNKHLGGMITGGLSRTDIGKSAVVGGIAREYFTRADAKYNNPQKTNGVNFWITEPHVAEQTINEMIKEAGIKVVMEQRMQSAQCKTNRVVAITTKDGKVYHGKVFIDATYEGDLMAQARVKYTVGREGRDQYGESLAGFYPAPLRPRNLEYMVKPGTAYTHGTPCVIPAHDASGMLYWGISDKPWPAPGTADKLVQSYNFRVIVTRDKTNQVPFPKPRNYYVERYELLLQLALKYPGIRFAKLVYIGGGIPNGKCDVNASGMVIGTDYLCGNTDYPEGDEATRARIWQDHVDYVQGFLWFLGHDERVPQDLRKQTSEWGLAKDEFVDNNNWPYALYIREARRMIGAYVMRQQDCQKEITKPDVIGMASFILDSHALQRLVTPEGNVIDEGNFDVSAPPYQLPYRCIIPLKQQCANLLVPVCLSATHVAYGSIRMEPHFMNLGHAAGLAAVAAARSGSAVQDIDVKALQDKLRATKQVLSFSPPNPSPK